VAVLFDGNGFKLASTEVLIQNSGPATSQITLDVTSTTVSTDPTITPRPISLVVADAGDIGSITAADLNNQTPISVVNLVRVGNVSRLPVYQRNMTGRVMLVLSSSTFTVGGAQWVISTTEPFTITWKFKNVERITVFDSPGNANGELATGGKFGELEFSGTQPDFSTFTISFAEPGTDAVFSLLFIEALLTDGFVCISDVTNAGRSVLSTNNLSRFRFGECPE
jgi:hypothetical protein